MNENKKLKLIILYYFFIMLIDYLNTTSPVDPPDVMFVVTDVGSTIRTLDPDIALGFRSGLARNDIPLEHAAAGSPEVAK